MHVPAVMFAPANTERIELQVVQANQQDRAVN